MIQFSLRSALLLLVIYLLVACGGEPDLPPTLIPTAAPVKTFTPVPTVTSTPLPSATPVPTTAVPTQTPVVQYPSATPPPTATPAPTATSMALGDLIEIGTSVEERPLTAVQFKNGPKRVIFVGGMHGGYEWNSINLAKEAIRFFTLNPDVIPDSVTLYIIPEANPDGMAVVAELAETQAVADLSQIPVEDTLAGRNNANDVDLNRNWDCNWRSSAYWRDQWVSGGSEEFSEPETKFLRDFFVELTPEVVVFWHSAVDGVYASGCNETYAPSFRAASIYGLAAGYPVHEKFDAYPVTGDASDWLAKEEIPSFTVELKDHINTDWSENLAGMTALLESYR